MRADKICFVVGMTRSQKQHLTAKLDVKLSIFIVLVILLWMWNCDSSKQCSNCLSEWPIKGMFCWLLAEASMFIYEYLCVSRVCKANNRSQCPLSLHLCRYGGLTLHSLRLLASGRHQKAHIVFRLAIHQNTACANSTVILPMQLKQLRSKFSSKSGTNTSTLKMKVKPLWELCTKGKSMCDYCRCYLFKCAWNVCGISRLCVRFCNGGKPVMKLCVPWPRIV